MRRSYFALRRLFYVSYTLPLIFSLLLISFGPFSTNVARPSATSNDAARGLAAASSQFGNWGEWRGSISKTPTPAAGCFVATYPSAVWQRTQCVSPPKGYSLPSTAAQLSAELQPSTVGNTNDWVAQVPYGKLISSSFGTFSSVSGLTSEKDVCVAPFLQECGGVNGGQGANFYSLQDNTNFGFAVNYYGKSTTGWEQFLFANGGDSGVVYIEYWLTNYGACPPASQDPPVGGVGWFPFGGSASTPASCVFNTNGTPTPFQPPTSLSKLSLQSYADFGGNDEVMLCVSGGSCYATSVTDTVLHLYRHWTDSEFNVFGYDNGAQAQFNSGTTIAVGDILLDYDANPMQTSCVSPPGFTGETNNLDLVSCSTSVTDPLALMTFTESNAPVADITIASAPLGSLYSTGSGFVIVDGDAVMTPETFVWIEGSTHSISAVSPVSCGVQCRYVFTGWSDQGGRSHSITVSVPLIPDGLFFPTYTANYQEQYYVTIQSSALGSVSASSGWYNVGTTVNLTAMANSQHTFKSWTGTGSGSYTGTNNYATITINGPITESANFS